MHCRNCNSLAVAAVAHVDHLAAIGRADDCFVVFSFGLSQTFSNTKFSLIPEACLFIVYS